MIGPTCAPTPTTSPQPIMSRSWGLARSEEYDNRETRRHGAGQLENTGVIEMYRQDKYKTKERRERNEREERERTGLSTRLYVEPAPLNPEHEGGECGRAIAGVREEWRIHHAESNPSERC